MFGSAPFAVDPLGAPDDTSGLAGQAAPRVIGGASAAAQTVAAPTMTRRAV